MRRTVLWLMAVGFLAGASGCVYNPQILLRKQLLSSIDEATDLLCQVKDDETAKEVQPRLKAVTSRMKELEEKLKALDKPKKKELEEFLKLFQEDMTTTASRLTLEKQRVMGLPGVNNDFKGQASTLEMPRLFERLPGEMPPTRGGGAERRGG
jgi:hypothetical protein